MYLTSQQVEEFDERGYLQFSGLLDAEEVAVLNTERRHLQAREGAEVVREPGSSAIRLIYGAHDYCEPFRLLSCLPRLLGPVRQLLRASAYIHQSRLDPRRGFTGDPWNWHQDFGVWRHEDGMKRPDCVMTAIMLDDTTAVNGPLLLVPGSHRHGEVREAHPEPDGRGSSVMRISAHMLEALARDGGIEALTGPAGTVAFIHCNLVHGSANNVSPWPRATLYLAYNSVENLPEGGQGRAWFLNNPDRTPLDPVDDDALHALSRAAKARRAG
ncbi:phytanoyl-CoA dioxygenase family protein [Marivibrio halodurans]|uniref:Phytanoyl-CoA dioxygenase family protein n=1 Tax=Marivibrio halodurans TaxID=2039722 RepID=A0A8J7RXU8_9PROT|nr:phytanoyl-CoA dioxygenase family protein [Marivibrio halodurans]MBP5856742.1 phytanoyl-CoA dioxygenase family protein [Marivibrio halodurans]